MPKRKDPAPEDTTPRKRSKAKNGVSEKRLNWAGRAVRFSAAPSGQTKERINRALPGASDDLQSDFDAPQLRLGTGEGPSPGPGSGHRLFLLDRKTVAPVGADNGPVEEFTILGATGNVYTVTIGRHPKCTCPDALKGNVCKHHLFVMLRVLGLQQHDALVWQKGLLLQEAIEVLGGSRSRRGGEDVLAAASVRDAYVRRTAGAGISSSEAGAAGQRAVEGECPICFDELVSGQDAVVFCTACGNNLHKDCFEHWSAQKRSAMQPVTCVLCRATWAMPAADGKEGGSSYVNLKHASAAHSRVSLEELYGGRAVLIGRGRAGLAAYLSSHGQ